jgi:hypothetical protein
VASTPPQVLDEQVIPGAHAPQVAPSPPQVKGVVGAQNAVPLAHEMLPTAQFKPRSMPSEALAAGAITVCRTGTDQATPPTMPALFRKSRRA